MLLSNLVKFFFVFGPMILCLAACGGSQTAADDNVLLTETPPAELPFSTKSPDVFSADIVINFGGDTRRISAARDGAKQFTEYNAGAENAYAILVSDKTYLLSRPKNIYAEQSERNGTLDAEPLDDLTETLLNRTGRMRFEEIGTGDGIKKFRAVSANGGNSEIIISVSEQFGIPIKQEFYSVSGTERTLRYSVEFKNFKLTAPAEIFDLPQDLRKVSPEEFNRTIRNEK